MLREVVYEGLAEHVGGLRKKGDKKYSEEQYSSLQQSLTNLRKENKHLKLEYNHVSKMFSFSHLRGFRVKLIHGMLIF